MRQVAARHDALLDAIITRHQGRRVKERGEGDSVFATFADPVDPPKRPSTTCPRHSPA
jgi:hypothetical protein